MNDSHVEALREMVQHYWIQDPNLPNTYWFLAEGGDNECIEYRLTIERTIVGSYSSTRRPPGKKPSMSDIFLKSPTTGT